MSGMMYQFEVENPYNGVKKVITLLKDLFPEIGANILYGQDYDKIYCRLIGMINDD